MFPSPDPTTFPAACTRLAARHSTLVSARYFGLPVYLVGSALVDPDPRDIDLVVPVPAELFTAMYDVGPETPGAIPPHWRRWARDCAKQSRELTLLCRRAVDFKTQPPDVFAEFATKPRRRLDTILFPEHDAPNGGPGSAG